MLETVGRGQVMVSPHVTHNFVSKVSAFIGVHRGNIGIYIFCNNKYPMDIHHSALKRTVSRFLNNENDIHWSSMRSQR